MSPYLLPVLLLVYWIVWIVLLATNSSDSFRAGPTIRYDVAWLAGYWLPLFIAAIISAQNGTSHVTAITNPVRWIGKRLSWLSEFTVGDFLSIAVLLIMHFIWLSVQLRQKFERMTEDMPARRRLHRSLKYIGNEFGYLSVWDMALCFLFAMRELNPVLSRLTHGCYFQRLPLHRLFGWLSLLWLAIHSALLAAFLWMKGTSGFDQLLHRLIPFGKSIRSEEAWVNLAGMIGLIALIGTGLLSLEWVRRNRYRLFLFTHIALTSTLVLMSFIHAWQSVVYVLPALALLIVDRAIPKVSGARFGNTAKVLSVRCNLVTLELRSPDGKSALPRYQPGSYLRLNVPVISRFDWHPFSIGSLWTDDSSRLLLFIKACGGFSRELLRLASNTPTGRIEINARGYFRNDSHTASYAKVLSGKDVFIAGGTGIVSFMPQLVYYYRQPPVVSTAPWLFWSVRHLKDLDIYPAEFISTIIRSERVKIFVTTPEDEETDQSEIVLAGNRGIYEKISDEGIDSNFESDHPPAASASPVNRSTALIFLTLIFSMGSYLLGRSIHLQLTPDDCRAEETNVSQFSGCILFYSLIPSLLILFTVFVLTLLFMWTLQYSHEKHEDVDDREQLLKYHRSVDAHVDLSLIKVYRGRIDVANELSTVLASNRSPIIDVFVSGPEPLVQSALSACLRLNINFHRESFIA